MNEQIYQLPEAFVDGHLSDTHVHFYETLKSSQKNKVCFNQHMLCLLLAGHKEVYCGVDHISFDNKKILLLQAGNALMTERITENNSYASILLFFSDQFLFKFINSHQLKLPQMKTDNHLYLFLKDQYVFNFENSLNLLGEKANKNNTLIRLKLEEILLYLFEKYPAEIGSFIQRALESNKNIPFRQIIHQQENLNLTNEELAFLCNCSISTFKRKFTEVFNTTPKQYFIEKRMNKAVALMQQSKRPSEIYFELGYENLSGFSSEFKKHFGVSPKTYVLQS